MAFSPPSVNSLVSKGFSPPAPDSLIDTPQAESLPEEGGNAEPIRATDILGSAYDYGQDVVGRAATQVLNIPADVIDTAGRMTGRFGPSPSLRFSPDKSLIPKSAIEAFNSSVRDIAQPLGASPSQPGTGPMTGIANTITKALEGFTTPTGLATLPLLESRLARGAMALKMASDVPATIQNAADTAYDPNATTAQKWEAMGDAGVNLAMTAGLALSLKPEAVKAKISPEEAARIVEQEAIKGGKPIIEPSTPKWEETKPLEVETPKPEEQNAPQIQPQPISVQEQPQGTVESGPRKETSVGNSVLSPENPQVGQGAEEPLNNETASTIPATQVEAGTEIPLQQEPATSSPTPETENAPLNPGGAYADLSPELKAKSDSVKDAMRAQYEALKAQSAVPIESVPEVPPEPIVDQSVNKSDEIPIDSKIIGLGGAIPSEFERSPQTPTGIKNATVDLERAKRGLPAAVEPLKRSFGEVWDKAMAHIDRDPKWQDDLIDELRDKPRALTDEEDAAILQRQVDLQNDYGKATRDLAQAHDDGNEDLAQENKLRVAQVSDQLHDIYNIGKRAGTETGRGLNARKMMAYEDFSLAQMELSKRAANDGRPLTDDERAHLVDVERQFNETKKAFDEHIAASKERLSKSESDAAIAKIKAEAASSTHKINPIILDTARKIVSNLDKRADAARLRIKERLSRTSAGVDPTLLLDLAEVGASHLAHAALDLGEWSVKMVSEFGDFIKPHLDEVYKASQDKIRKATAENPLELARVMREKPTEEQIKANAARIGEKVKEGKKDEITHFVQRIARLLVQSGVTERDELLTRVHDILKDSLPDITRRETMDAISGYGDFKQLTKDQISVQLRGIKGEMQQLAKLEDMAANKPPLKSGVERRIPSEAERQLIKKVNEAKFAFQVPMTDPATQLKSALDTYKTNLRNRTVDLQAKLDAKDFSPRPKRELVLDNEAMKLKAANEAVKQKFQHELALDRLKKRSAVEKTGDAIVKWRRGFILSGPVTLAKLTSAAIARMVITPAEELVGHGLSKLPLVKQISERAPREGGGFNTRAEVKAITEGLTKGASDAWQTLKTGKSDLSLVYGKDKGLPQSFIDIFGNIHGALKAPVKRAEFARSLQKRLDFYAKQGVDVTDEFVQMRAGLEAYQDADRAIFMQKNIINDAYKRALSRFDQKDKVTGKPTVGGKIAGTVSRVLFPIVKVPTNIVAETMQFAVGSITGSTRLGLTFKNGIENLKPEEADLIMRHLKKGSLGGAVMLTGFLAPQILGGFYQQGEKRNKSDIKPDAARVGGVDIPASLIHNPMVNAAQLGATVRRVSDSKLRKRDKNTQGLSHGAIAGAVGLADAVPFVRETTEIAKAMNPLERDQWAGAFAKSLVVPQAISSTAEHFDKDAQGNPIKRKTSDVTSGIESGIPGMRQTLPVKR